MFFKETIVFRTGVKSNFRIPSIVTDKNGIVYAFCNDRINTLSDAANETALMFARKQPGQEWEKPVPLVHIPGWACTIGSAVYDDETDTVMCSVSKIAVQREEFGYYSKEDLEIMAAKAKEKEIAAGTK